MFRLFNCRYSKETAKKVIFSSKLTLKIKRVNYLIYFRIFKYLMSLQYILRSKKRIENLMSLYKFDFVEVHCSMIWSVLLMSDIKSKTRTSIISTKTKSLAHWCWNNVKIINSVYFESLVCCYCSMACLPKLHYYIYRPKICKPFLIECFLSVELCTKQNPAGDCLP